MGILSRLFGRKQDSLSQDVKHDELQQPEDRLKENTPSTVETPPEESPEKSLRSNFLKAIYNEQVENVKAALEAGADPNCIIEDEFQSSPEDYPSYHGESPLMLAAAIGNAEIVGILLDAGAIPNFRDSYGRDALIKAALRLDSEFLDRLPVIEELLKRGADPNHTENNFQSAIQLAAYYGHVEAVKTILNSSLVTETFNLEKAIDTAEENGNQEICNLVKDYIEKVKSGEETVTAETNADATEHTTADKTIYFGEMMPGETVEVTISVEGNIHGSDLYGGKYHAKLPLDMVSDQLLNHIADKIGVIGSFHMGYMLLLEGETILTCKEKKTLRDTDAKDGDALIFIDWG